MRLFSQISFSWTIFRHCLFLPTALGGVWWLSSVPTWAQLCPRIPFHLHFLLGWVQRRFPHESWQSRDRSHTSTTHVAANLLIVSGKQVEPAISILLRSSFSSLTHGSGVCVCSAPWQRVPVSVDMLVTKIRVNKNRHGFSPSSWLPSCLWFSLPDCMLVDPGLQNQTCRWPFLASFTVTAVVASLW